MESSEIEQLAIELEDEDLIGEDGRLLVADDIVPVIEALWRRGAEFDDLLGGAGVAGTHALDSVSPQD